MNHLHAQDDAQLVGAVLRHVRRAHPDLRFREQGATSLVSEASYAHLKHAKNKDWLDTAGRLVG